MPFFDLSLEELQQYRPTRSEPKDFDLFWQETLAEARKYPLHARFESVQTEITTLDVYDVTFAGYGGQDIKGWYLRPAGVAHPLPCIVQFIGYGGGRGFPLNWLTWPSAGYACLVMDIRGQGGSWLQGDTPDTAGNLGSSTPGFMTQGILDPQHYYYRRVYVDAVRVVEAARSRPDVLADKIAVTGGSQGGGITIAVAGLLEDIAVCMPDVPFLCHFRQALGKTDHHPYEEIVKFLSVHRTKVQQIFHTLDYFDGMNFAARIQARTLFSVALMDMTCAPSTVFAAYNHVNAPKDIRVYEFNDHEGGQIHHTIEQIRFVNNLWR